MPACFLMPLCSYFYPRPRVEGDMADSGVFASGVEISTHALA